MVALQLAKSGYYGGDPDAVLAAPVSSVVTIVRYEHFLAQYESTYTHLNRPS